MSVTPDFIGQRYRDSLTGNIWKANSTTPGDWTLELQNMYTSWLPTSLNLKRFQNFYLFGCSGVTDVTLTDDESFTIDIETCPDLLSVSAPNLVRVWYSAGNPGAILIWDNPALLTVDFPSFSMDGVNIEFNGNTSLVSANVGLWVPYGGGASSWNFTNNAFNATTVNHILARFVAANPPIAAGDWIKLNGGTNAAPTGQGITDKNTLVAQGATVDVNP